MFQLHAIADHKKMSTQNLLSKFRQGICKVWQEDYNICRHADVFSLHDMDLTKQFLLCCSETFKIYILY